VGVAAAGVEGGGQGLRPGHRHGRDLPVRRPPLFYPVEAAIVSFVLAVVPYLLLRGPVNLARHRWGGDADARHAR
jgi:hypothetical protein